MLSARSLKLRDRGAGAPVLSLVLFTAGACVDTPLHEAGILDGQVLLHFRGTVSNGDIVLDAVSAEDVDGNAFDVAVPGTTQALTRIREDKNNDPGSAGAVDGIELIVERQNGFAPPGTVVDGCAPGVPSFDVNVTVRNFFTVELSNVYAEINAISAPGHELCNSDKATPNLQVADDGTTLAVDNGLVRYGNLLRDPNGPEADPATLVPPPLGADTSAQAMLWRFKNGSGTFSFNGRVVADICSGDCTAGTILQEGPLAPPITNAKPFGDTNGTIDDIVEGDGVIYVVGDFTAAGPRTGSAFSTARSTTSTGTALTPWAPFVGGETRALEPDGQGGFYAAGAFTSVGNDARARLVHILSDGTTDPTFVPPAAVTGANTVTALHLDTTNNVLWVGRDRAPFLSALKPSTGATAFTIAAQPGDTVFDIIRAGSVVVVSGEFRNLGNNGRDKIAVYDTAGALQSFALPVTGGGNVSVDAVATDGSTIWFGGEFTDVGGTTRNHLAAVAISNSALLPWNPNVNGNVTELTLVPGATPVIVFAGTFGSVNGQARQRIAAINANPATPSPAPRAWNPGVGNTIDEIFVDTAQNTVYAAGAFTAFGGVARAGYGAVAADFNTATPTVRPWAPIAGASARHVIAVDPVGGPGPLPGRVLVGGAITFGGYTARSNVAAFDLQSGALVNGFVADATGGGVHAATLVGGTLYLGGTFTQVNGQSHTRLAAVDAVTGAVNAGFTASASADVLALAASPSHLYVGGNFTQLNATGRNRVGRLSLAGALDTAWNPNVNSIVHALAVDGSDVYVAGQFTSLGGDRARRLARVSTSTPAALLQNFEANSSVFGLSINRNVLYFGGAFTNVLGGNRSRAAAVDLRTHTLVSTFAPNVGGNGTVVRAVSAAGSAVVLGGNFTNVGGSPRLGAAVVDGTNGSLFASQPLRAQGDVRSVAIIGRVTAIAGVLNEAGIDTAGTNTRSVRTSFAAINAD